MARHVGVRPLFPSLFMHVILLCHAFLFLLPVENPTPRQTRRSRARPAEVVALHIVQYILSPMRLGHVKRYLVYVMYIYSKNEVGGAAASLVDLAHIHIAKRINLVPFVLLFTPTGPYICRMNMQECESQWLSNLRDSYGGHINRIK